MASAATPAIANFLISTSLGGVDLTFATHLAAGPSGECQTPNSTRTLILPVAPQFQHSQKYPPRRDANVGTGPPAGGGRMGMRACAFNLQFGNERHSYQDLIPFTI